MRTVGFALLSLSLLVGAARSAPSVECFVQCVAGAACQLALGSERLDLGFQQRAEISDCGGARLTQGERLQGKVYSVKEGPLAFAITARDRNRTFSEVQSRLFADADCLGRHARCAETRDKRRISVPAGKGVDRTVSERLGEPCAAGLPCGLVMSPSKELVFSLLASHTDGRLQVRPLRHTASAWTADVSQGRIVVRPGQWSPGKAYAYTLVDTRGAKVLAGEFEVLSQRMQSDVEAQLAALPDAGDNARLARVELLLDNDLWWDAMQHAAR